MSTFTNNHLRETLFERNEEINEQTINSNWLMDYLPKININI